MTGTDYNADGRAVKNPAGTDYGGIVAELNKPTAIIRPKAQPDDSHIMGRNQARLKMRTGNGEDAHLWPAKRYCDIAPNETERDRKSSRKNCIKRNDRLRREREEKEKLKAANNLAEMVRGLGEIFKP